MHRLNYCQVQAMRYGQGRVYTASYQQLYTKAISKLEIETQNRNQKSKLEIETRNRSQKSKLFLSFLQKNEIGVFVSGKRIRIRQRDPRFRFFKTLAECLFDKLVYLRCLSEVYLRCNLSSDFSVNLSIDFFVKTFCVHEVLSEQII